MRCGVLPEYLCNGTCPGVTFSSDTKGVVYSQSILIERISLVGVVIKMNIRKALIIAYDIQSTKYRRQVFNMIKPWRIDGQKSFHECLMNKMETEKLFNQIMSGLDKSNDSLLMAWCEPHRQVLFRGEKRISENNLIYIN